MTEGTGEWEYRIRINGLAGAVAWGLFFAFWLIVLSAVIAGGIVLILFLALSDQGSAEALGVAARVASL